MEPDTRAVERIEAGLRALAGRAGRDAAPVTASLRREAARDGAGCDWGVLAPALADAVERRETDGDPTEAFVGLLPHVLAATASPIGFIAEVRFRRDHPYLYSHAVSNAHAGFGEAPVLRDLVFDNLETLNGAILTSRAPVIANHPERDPRSGGLPPGHERLAAYLGLPGLLEGDLLAAVALANRPSGYDEATARELEPLAAACALMVAAPSD